jgi:uncharacterized protein with NRDE domain
LDGFNTITGSSWEKALRKSRKRRESRKNLINNYVMSKSKIPKCWKKIVFASDLPKCDCCEEEWCEEHNTHFADCECIGPTQDNVEYKEFNGFLYGKIINHE